MSPNPSDELDPTLPGPASSRPGSQPPSTPHEPADADADATLMKSPGRTQARGPGGTRPGEAKTASDDVDLTRPSPARTSARTNVSSASTSAGAEGGASSSKREPQVFGGRFEVIEMLGEGGMGKVYTVRDRQIEGRAVALKVLLPKFSRNEKFRSLFFQEIRAAQNFVNEHVVQVRDCGQMDDGRLFVTMDLVSGESLRDMLARENTLRPRHALEIAKQMLAALHSGHERGFVHRDVKPSNVMLATRVSKTDENPYGVGVRVLDFGIAGLAAEIDEGNVAGTPLYMSPEQIQGQRLDARSDLFAVGIVLYEMLAGHRPFEGKTLQQITHSVIETDVAPRIAEMKELSAPIRKILEKALQKDRDKRFQSATEFIEAIEKSSAYKLPSAVPGWVVGALVVVSGVAGVEGYLLWSQQGRAEALADARDRLQSQVNEAQATLTTRLAEADNAHRSAITGKDAELASAAAALTAANEALEAARVEIARLENEKTKIGAKDDDQLVELRGRLQALELAIEQERKARETASQEKATLDQELLRMREAQDRLTTALDEARRERDALTAQLNPAARKANAFDDVLSILERRGGAQARSLYDQAITERIFERPSRPGTDLVEELVEAELAVQRFDTSRAQGGALDIPSLLEASRHLTQAKNLRQNFQVAANEWLSFETPDGTAATRTKRLDDYLRTLSERVLPEVSAISEYHVQDWERVSAGGPTQALQGVLEHQRQFSCDHVAEFARSTLAHCESALAPGGKLDTKALAAASFLDEWGAHLESKDSLRDESASGLLAFVYARRWHDADEGNDAGFDWTRAANPAVSSEQRDWRAVLRLQYALAQPEAGYPIKSGRKLVYRLENDSPLRWRVLEPKSGVEIGPAGPWEFTQSNFKSDALPIGGPEPIRVVRRRGVFLVDGASDPLLDLRAAGDNVWVAPFPKLFDKLPPPQLGVSQVSMNEHLERIAAGPGPCLVFKRGALVRWFSPEFGLVLEELEGQPVRTELVFATPLR